jgi:protein ImuA
MSLAVSELRQRLAAVVAGIPSTTPGLPTGLAALDAALPGGGMPPGRITELLAAPGFGKTTITRSLVRRTLAAGHCVAWIDATRTLDPRDLLAAAGPPPDAFLDALWVVRPPDPARAPWCADLLLRTGAFALVVLDGAPVLPRVVAIRLAQLAREADAVLLLLGDGTRASEVGGALRLVMRRREVVTLEKGGPHQHVSLRLVGQGGEVRHDEAPVASIAPVASVTPVAGVTSVTGGVPARRVRAHPEIPDRRGVARSRNRRSRR